MQRVNERSDDIFPANALRLAGVLVICKLSWFSIAGALTPAAPWPSYNNTLDSQRYANLGQITPENIASLGEKCELAVHDEGPFQSGLLVIGDTLYVTTKHASVALSATDCKVRWRHVYALEENEVYPVNRGAAYLDGRLFRGTSDGRLIALDATTGKLLWNVKAADPKVGEFFSAAPIAWKGLLFIGPAGSDWGTRGRMAAFDLANGREVWRFNTIPMGNEPGAETWKNPQSAKRGGGGTWTSYTLDVNTGELFIPVGNPGPDLNPDLRPGDNLYTNSLVVLDAATGALKWYYQFVKNDGFDWDTSAAPTLYTAEDGRARVALGTKDGHVYSLDRLSHQLIFKTPVTTILNADKRPTVDGIRVCPGALGGVEWNGLAYNPITRYLYVGAVDWCSVYSIGTPKYDPPNVYVGTALMPSQTDARSGWISALNAQDGSVAWKYHAAAPVVAGITSTAAGLVFSGDLAGNLLALDSKTGQVLLQKNLAGPLAGGLITYSVSGHQYLAVTAGNVSRAVFGTGGSPRVVILTTGLGQDHKVAKLAVQDTQQLASNSEADHGKEIFASMCSACHGAHGEGGISAPDLTEVGAHKDLDSLVTFIRNPLAPMPKLYPDLLDADEVRSVAQYVLSLSKGKR